MVDDRGYCTTCDSYDCLHACAAKYRTSKQAEKPPMAAVVSIDEKDGVFEIHMDTRKATDEQQRQDMFAFIRMMRYLSTGRRMQ